MKLRAGIWSPWRPVSALPPSPPGSFAASPDSAPGLPARSACSRSSGRSGSSPASARSRSSNFTLVLSAVAVAAVTWGLAVRNKAISAEWLKPFAAAEVIYLVAFLAFIWYSGLHPPRSPRPKPMDSAFLSATIRTTDMPPADPWMAGEMINYYYLGYLLNGSVAGSRGCRAGLPSTWRSPRSSR